MNKPSFHVMRATAAMLMMLASAGAAAAETAIDADATGNWFAPDQSGHGLQIEVIDLSQALVAWYTFDTAAEPMWLFGMGEISGDTLHADLQRFSGTRFPPDFAPGEIEGEHWGRIEFTRTGCDTATLDYTPENDEFLPGQLSLERLTRVDGSACDEQWAQTVRWQPGNDPAPSFEALFLDYPDGSEDFYELESGPRQLPEPWQDDRGMMISGNNHSDDLMMVLMRSLQGLAPNTLYRVALEMQFATNVPDGCVGVGGSPGEGVYMRLGASSEKPDYTLVDGHRRATLDLGQQARPGEDALSAGNMANGLDAELCTDPDRPWLLKRVSTTGQPFEVMSDGDGRIWVYGLSDSAFEATSTWYLTEFVIRLAEAD